MTDSLNQDVLLKRVEELETENAALKALWKDARIPVMKALRLQAENESLKAQLTVDEIGGKEGLNITMALQPLLVTYADATRAYFDHQASSDFEGSNTLYHAMKVAETAIHWFVNSRHAASQVAEINQLQSALAELEAINERQAQTIALLKRAAPPLTRLWASSTGLLDRFEAYPTVIQASKRMMDEATELIVAANDTYGHSTEDIAKEAVDVWVTAINVLRAAQVDDATFYAALEDVMTSNDGKTDKTHQRSAQNGVERLSAKEAQS